ncbi:MAG: tRNA lysidine(34) synthetase TilS [Candidatus Saccharimonadia bacterium]
MNESTLLPRLQLPQPGFYVMAISGGVDSISMMDMLASLPRPPWSFLVAHVNHGMRKDASQDEQLVAEMATKYSFPSASTKLNLMGQSENVARKARYLYLRELAEKSGAAGIITAHHGDDRLETAVFNSLRGSDRRGLIALRSYPFVIRPMLDLRKTELRQYALDHGLRWREDSTNADLRIARNFIRSEITPLLSEQAKQNSMSKLSELEKLEERIARRLARIIKQVPSGLAVNLADISELSGEARKELITEMARTLDPSAELSKAGIARAALALKTGKTNQKWPITSKLWLCLDKSLIIVSLQN